jgi:hypothetical protein
MNELTRSIHREQIQNALALVLSGKTQVEACEEIGISVRTFRDWINKEPEMITQILAQKREKAEENYENVSSAWQTLLDKLLDKAKAVELNYEDVLFLERRLSIIKTELEAQLASVPSSTQQSTASTFLEQLKSPILRPGKAVVTRREIETTIEISPDHKDSGEIVDAEFSNLEN